MLTTTGAKLLDFGLAKPSCAVLSWIPTTFPVEGPKIRRDLSHEEDDSFPSEALLKQWNEIGRKLIDISRCPYCETPPVATLRACDRLLE